MTELPGEAQFIPETHYCIICTELLTLELPGNVTIKARTGVPTTCIAICITTVPKSWASAARRRFTTLPKRRFELRLMKPLGDNEKAAGSEYITTYQKTGEEAAKCCFFLLVRLSITTNPGTFIK
jgi:hypothetical protein